MRARPSGTYSTRFNDFALEFYSFVADNYAPFYSRPVECTDRDAPFVLDGVLYHESDLNLEEHYTDTHGYTEINFAAFGMVGMRFYPRIRSLHRQRIYCADPARDHGVLEPVLQRGRRAVNFRLIAEQWDRIGQFYAAFPAGHATASAALQRLNRFQASNRFYAANRELGRALKTEFVLQYMSEPKLRAKVRRGLLKVEQLHALARAVYYGQRGRISAREVYDQMNACSCLTLILACIVYWQALGDLTPSRRAGLSVRPRPAAARQPDRVEERRPLRRDQDRPRQAHEAWPLACISTRIWSVPLPGPRPDGFDRCPLALGGSRGGPEAAGATSQRRLRSVLGLPRSARIRTESRPAIRCADSPAGQRAAPAALSTTPSTRQVALAMPLAEAPWAVDEEEPHPRARRVGGLPPLPPLHPRRAPILSAAPTSTV